MRKRTLAVAATALAIGSYPLAQSLTATAAPHPAAARAGATVTTGGVHSDPHIVGGVPAAPDAWPMAVSLDIADTPADCTGTMISPDIVLTAQHCLESPNLPVVAHIGNIDPAAGETRRVVDYVTGAGHSRGDWAVAKLDSPVQLSAYAQLPADASQDAAPMFTAFGWGDTDEDGHGATRLMQVDLPLYAGAACGDVADSEICASGNGVGGKDTCQGDSGGPLFVQGSYVEVGVTSWGNGCGRPTDPGHYTKVSAYTNEIRAAVTRLGGQDPAVATMR